jgi:hypothetical protein
MALAAAAGAERHKQLDTNFTSHAFIVSSAFAETHFTAVYE